MAGLRFVLVQRSEYVAAVEWELGCEVVVDIDADFEFDIVGIAEFVVAIVFGFCNSVGWVVLR